MKGLLPLLPDNVHLIGDPHLGKKFEVGVPFHRRGEREAGQFKTFREQLDVDEGIVIIVGDLFDHPYVGFAVIEETARSLLTAAEFHPDTVYLVMAGNHDLPKNVVSIGAFHDLEDRLRDRFPNLMVVRRPLVYKGIALFPWEWGRRANDQVKDIENEDVLLCVGHWDLTKFSERDDHLAPVGVLREAFGQVPLFSGHYHVPGKYGEVTCTGSMEPYSHGEDPTEAKYTTKTLSEALAAPDGAFKNMCLRVILKPGEDLPEIDCLALTSIKEKAVDLGATPVSLEAFDWAGIVNKKLEPIHPVVRDFIKERLVSEAISD